MTICWKFTGLRTTEGKICRRSPLRATERSVSRQQPVDVLTQNRMDAQRFLLILNRKLGQNAGHTPCEHGLTRTGRADHEQAELTCRRKCHTPFGNLLPQHIGIVELGFKGGLEHFRIQVMSRSFPHALGKL